MANPRVRRLGVGRAVASLLLLAAGAAAGERPRQAARLDAPVPAGTLADLKTGFRSGRELGYFVFDPDHPRCRRGPGTTGDELLRCIEAGRFPPRERCLHVDYIYGWFWQNCRRYYMAYRVSGDPYYVDQLHKYAEAMDWVLADRPRILYPKDRRDGLGRVTVEMIPWEPAAASNLVAHVYAARLTLRRARRDPSGVSARRIAEARKHLDTVVRYMASLVRPGGAADEATGLPAEAARIIREVPWNQNMMYFAVLAGAAVAMDDLHHLRRTDRYRDTADLYARIVRAGIDRFKRVSDVTEIDGRPYVFHSHHPGDPLLPRKAPPDGRIDGHPVFRYPEDVPHSQSAAWNLLFLWETGERFGVTDRLLAGFVNAHVDYVLKRRVTYKDGSTGPPNHLLSPWTQQGRPDYPYGPLRRAGVVYAAYLTFNREVADAIRAQGRRYDLRGKDRLFLLYARYIHAKRSDRDLPHLAARTGGRLPAGGEDRTVARAVRRLRLPGAEEPVPPGRLHASDKQGDRDGPAAIPRHYTTPRPGRLPRRRRRWGRGA